MTNSGCTISISEFWQIYSFRIVSNKINLFIQVGSSEEAPTTIIEISSDCLYCTIGQAS